jgi:glutaredoxin
MRNSALLLGLLLAAGLALAQSTYRWVDQDGKVHYGDRPPAKNARELQERKYSAPAADKPMSTAMRQAAASFPVTLYVTPDCGTACQEGRDYLAKRGIPYAEKSVEGSDEIAALRERLGGGDTVVPVLMVGDKHRKGFLESAWAGLLDAAGYPGAGR